jgi:hypothetical protein
MEYSTLFVQQTIRFKSFFQKNEEPRRWHNGYRARLECGR